MADLAGYKRADDQFRQVLKTHRPAITEQSNREVACAARIMDILGRSDDIDRYITAGSVGFHIRGGTKNMFRADFDLYIYFNLSDTSNVRIQESIPRILSEVCAKIRSNSWYSICRGDPDQGSISVEEMPSISTGYRNVANVFAAVNFGKGKAQWEELLKRNAEDMQTKTYLKWSHMEMTAKYLKDQPQFVLDVVSLAKCWNERSFLDGFFLRQSFIVELVAVKAAQDEIREMKERKTMSAALERFFTLMGKDMGDVSVVLDPVEGDLPEGWMEQYKMKKGEDRVLLDPTNPYVNYFDDEDVSKHWSKLREKAFKSLGVWAEVQKGVYSAGHLIGVGSEDSCSVM